MADRLRVQSMVEGKVTGTWGSGQHHTSIREAEAGEGWCSALLFLFVLWRPQPLAWTTTFRVGLSTAASLI